jgi:hypothetical protein
MTFLRFSRQITGCSINRTRAEADREILQGVCVGYALILAGLICKMELLERIRISFLDNSHCGRVWSGGDLSVIWTVPSTTRISMVCIFRPPSVVTPVTNCNTQPTPQLITVTRTESEKYANSCLSGLSPRNGPSTFCLRKKSRTTLESSEQYGKG